MTLPNGIDGIAEAVGKLFGTTGPSTSVAGAETWGVSPISTMNTLTQSSVQELLKTNMIRNSAAWNATSAAIYQGLTPGIPWSLAIIEQFVSAMTGLPLGSWETVNEAILALEGIAANADLEANWITLLTDLGVPNAAALAAYISGLQGDINDSQAASATLWTSWGAALTEIVGGNWIGGLDDAETAWETYQTAITGITSSEWVTIRQFFASIGIDLPSGQIVGTNVSNVLGTASLSDDVQAILDYLANALGHSGTGHTLTDIESYFGIIPPANVSNVLGTASLGDDVQAILDYIANALGHSGTGHTLTDIESYFGIIPPANVANTLGGSNLGDDINTFINNLVSEFLGVPVSSTQSNANAAAALANVNNTLVALSSQVQQNQTRLTGNSQYGQGFQVPFSAFPATSLPSSQAAGFTAAPFDISYSGAGTGYLALNGGNATWEKVNDGDVSVIGVYITGYNIAFTGTPTSFTLTYNGQTTSAITYSTVTAAAIQAALQALTNMPANNVTVTAGAAGSYDISFVINGILSGAATGVGSSITVSKVQGVTNGDYQELHATIAGLPNGAGSKNFACLRMNAAKTTYVYGLVYLAANYQLDWELGCYVAGVKTVIASGVNAPLNFNFTFRAGVGGNPYRFQGVSGSQVVFDVIDNVGTGGAPVSQVGSAFRGFGFRSDTASGGTVTPAPASYVGCADNALPTTKGSGFRMSCSSTTSRAISVGTNTSPPGVSPVWGYFPSGFFDTIDNITPDIVQSTFSGQDAVTINVEDWFMFELRCQQNAVAGSGVVSIYAGYLRNGVFESLANGASVAVNVLGTQWAPTAFGGNCPIYCRAGDQIVPIVYVDTLSGTSFLSGLDVFGEANNRLTYWSMTKMFGSGA